MELKDYNIYAIFLKTVELKNYTRAAEAVGLSSHKIISEKMRLLEDKLGVKLFVRTHRSMEPTSDAYALYDRVKKALRDLDMAVDGTKEFDQNSEAIVRMGIPSSFASVLFQDFFKDFYAKYPKIRLQFFDKDSIDLLSQKELDLVINMESALGDHGMNSIELFTQNCIMIASEEFCKKHGLGKSLTKEKFAELPVIGHRQALQGLRGIVEFTSLVETATGGPIYAFAKNGLGIGYYYSKLLKNLHSGNDRIRILDIDDVKLPEVKIVCVFDVQNLTQAAKEFIEDLRKFCLARL